MLLTMAWSVNNLFVIIGLVSLGHAAYSATQHRTYLRLTEQEFTWLPADILAQCVLSLLLTCYGIVQVSGEFKDIRAAGELENKTWETLSNRPSFYTFNHRGKALYADMEDHMQEDVS
ncbi:membrane magnesium transporter 1 [Lingula anatina]|uniref:Membrane magnesium transporter n=1 Tax=Lingula anatina TaxID=7574 RepID=A0A1S3JPD8_LINAN|nr:membrane magnesium transporter 1 [Lingula anatina]|eukprot:XP_013411864.1 membrane magnesium transporter 1 [Lingula anatina]